MAYELFTKPTAKKRRRFVERPFEVSLDRAGRLKLNQGFYKTLTEKGFKKAEILVDYDRKKIALKMLTDDAPASSEVKKITHQERRARTAFLSFVKVRNALKLSFPFVRPAPWDEKNQLVEFTWKEEKNDCIA